MSDSLYSIDRSILILLYQSIDANSFAGANKLYNVQITFFHNFREDIPQHNELHTVKNNHHFSGKNPLKMDFLQKVDFFSENGDHF